MPNKFKLSFFFLMLVSLVLIYSCNRGEKRIDFYSNGKIKEEGRVKQDELGNFIKVGNWSFYDTNGDIDSVGSYKEGKKHGNWKYYSGENKAREIEFKNGMKHGKCINYDYKGRKEDEFYLKNDSVRGKHKEWFPESGKIKRESNYLTGIVYYSSWSGGNFSIKKEKLQGKYIEYCSNGQIKEKGEYENGERNSDWIFYYCNGQIKEKGRYKNGKKISKWVSYHDNGQTEEKGEYKNGKKIGKWISYHNNGQIEVENEFSYEQGRINQYLSFHPNGKKEIIGTKRVLNEKNKYVADGTGKRWYSNGSIYEIYEYKNGEIQWRNRWYYNGVKQYEEKYKNGEKWNCKYYDKEGYNIASIYNGNGYILGTEKKGNFSQKDTSGRKYTCNNCSIVTVYQVKKGKKNYKNYKVYTNRIKRRVVNGKSDYLYNPDGGYKKIKKVYKKSYSRCKTCGGDGWVTCNYHDTNRDGYCTTCSNLGGWDCYTCNGTGRN